MCCFHLKYDHPEDEANTPKYIKFMVICLEQLPRPVVPAEEDPSQWSVGAGARRSACTDVTHNQVEPNHRDPLPPSLQETELLTDGEESESDSDESD